MAETRGARGSLRPGYPVHALLAEGLKLGRRFAACLLLSLLAVDAAAQAASRPKVALALGGGGARGGAHIGVLSVLEELRIPVDCIAATSMGALVGGAYAAGVSPAEIQELVRTRLAAHEYPRHIAFVAELPKTPAGKVHRKVLRERELVTLVGSN